MATHDHMIVIMALQNLRMGAKCIGEALIVCITMGAWSYGLDWSA